MLLRVVHSFHSQELVQKVLGKVKYIKLNLENHLLVLKKGKKLHIQIIKTAILEEQLANLQKK